MTDAPERIWAVPYDKKSWKDGDGAWSQTMWHPDSGPSEYIAVTALSSADEVQELIRAAVEKERVGKRPENYREFLQAQADNDADFAEELEDLICEALTDANDLDVTFRDFAKAVVAAIRGTKP
jgi:hypothetical protein